MRQQLDQAIGSSPVSTVDVDRVVATARRHRLGRQFAVAGAAGGTAVAVVGVITAVVFSLAGAPTPTPVPPPTQVQPAASGGAAPVRAGETPTQAGQRLAAALTTGLTAALPGSHIADSLTGQPDVVVDVQGDRYTADAVLTGAAGQSEVLLESWSGGRTPAATAPTPLPGQPAPPVVVTWFASCADVPRNDAFTGDGDRLVVDCQESTGPEGQSVVAVTERCLDCPTPTTYRYDVYVTWSNARVGLAVVRDTKRGGPDPSRTAPLLTLEQVIAIASDPGLTVTA